MSEVKIQETFELPLELDDAYAFLISPPAYQTFIGWGPIPGILRLDWHEGNSSIVGSTATVNNTDGSTHRETVTVADAPTRYAIRIDQFSSVFNKLVNFATEEWTLSAAGSSTRVERCFTFTLKSAVLKPVGLIIGRFFRKAVRVNHKEMVLHLSRTKAGADPAKD